jgi:hypothetical protein
MKNTYTTLPFSTWNEYKSFVSQLSENWAFRGQASEEWRLQNAIERTDFIHLYKGVEVDFVAEFERGARNYLAKDETPEHLIEWLALMQHHGAPTRLLDFSKSPFVAAFFAFEQWYADAAVAIWAMNMQFVKTKALAKLQEYYPDAMEENSRVINESLFKTIFQHNEYSLIFPVEPFRMNRRYSLQQSIFVSTANSREPFMDQLQFLGDDISKAVIKIELPANLQKEVLRDLQKMNLNRASLFPDLDGYAASLRLRYNSLQSPQESLAQQLHKLGDEHFPFIP